MMNLAFGESASSGMLGGTMEDDEPEGSKGDGALDDTDEDRWVLE